MNVSYIIFPEHLQTENQAIHLGIRKKEVADMMPQQAKNGRFAFWRITGWFNDGVSLSITSPHELLLSVNVYGRSKHVVYHNQWLCKSGESIFDVLFDNVPADGTYVIELTNVHTGASMFRKTIKGMID